MSRHTLFTALATVRAELASSGLVVAVVLVALLAAMVGAWTGRRPGLVAVGPLALAWLVVDGSVEGPTLLPLTWSHGVTLADLLSLAALIVLARGLTRTGPTAGAAAR